jgi:hypothetical protein
MPQQGMAFLVHKDSSESLAEIGKIQQTPLH